MQANYILPKEAVEEFKRIYKKKFNVDLSDEEAVRRANNLLNLYRAVYGSTKAKAMENY